MSSMYSPYGAAPTKLCQRCGAPLPPNELYCANCGYYNTPSQMNGPTNQAQPSGMPWGASTPSTSYGSGQYGGQQPTPYGGQSWDQPPMQSPFAGLPPTQQPFYAPPAMPGGFQQGSMNAFNDFQPSQFNQPPQKRGPGAGLIIGIILLLVVLIGGGIGGFLVLKSQGNKTATPTATTAKPTPTPSVKPLFSDSFQNNNNGWDTTSEDGKFSVKVGSGSLILEDDDHKLLPELIPGKTFADFTLAVDAVLSKGDQNNGYGVFIRTTLDQQSDLATYYCFELYGDGTYGVFKGTVDTGGTPTRNRIVGYPTNDAIKNQGSLNHIEIVAKGSSMSFVVNGTTLYTLNDDNYKSGAAALFVSNLPSPTPPVAQATFTNLVIYPA
jgi:hypothetical protein